MTHAIRGEVEMVAGDDKFADRYTLVFDPNAFCYAEEALGKTTDEMLDAFKRGKVGFLQVRALIYGGLQAKHPCHLIRAGEIVGEVGKAEAGRAALKGAFLSLGVNIDEEEEAAPRPEGEDGPRP